jgi:hypothetical protein
MNMARVSAWLRCVLVLTLLTAAFAPAATPCRAAADMPDMVGHWARDHVRRLVLAEIVKGLPDGNFHPEGTLSRAQFITMLGRAANLRDGRPARPTFTDLPSTHWAAGKVEAGVAAGIVKPSEFPSGSFGPDVAITRQEIAVYVVRAMGLEELAARTGAEALDARFADARAVAVAGRGHTAVAVNKGILLGFEDRTFRPGLSATRAQAAVMVGRMLDASAAGATDAALPAGWTRVQSPHGFAAAYPEGWGNTVAEDGTVLIGADLAGRTGPVVVMICAEGLAGRSLTEAHTTLVAAALRALGGGEVIGTRELAAGRGLVSQVRATRGQREYAGVVEVSVQGQDMVLTGFLAPRDTYTKYAPVCITVINRFAFAAKLRDPVKVQGVVEMAQWVDPNEKAFTVSVPRGWKVSGGLVRPYIDAGVHLELDGGTRSGMLFSNPFPPIFSIPNWATTFAGFTEGSPYNPGGAPRPLIIREYRTPAQYLRQLFPGAMAQRVVITREISITERPDLVPATISGGLLPGMQVNIQAAEGVFELADGRQLVAVAHVQRTLMSGTGLWVVILKAYWGPVAELPLLGRIATAMESSFRTDPGWAAREAEQMAIRSRIISQTGEQIASGISQSFKLRSESQDRIAKGFSNVILGRTDVYDGATGEKWNVPAGSRYYWTRAGEIYGTEWPTAPFPDPDFRELQVLGPGP